MPYYSETYLNKSVVNSLMSSTNVVVEDSTKLLTFRSGPKANARSSVVVQDSIADPYAHFLTSTSERRYRERLRERNLPADASPDRGHAFELVKHRVSAPYASVVQIGGALRSFQGRLYVGGTVNTPLLGPNESLLPSKAGLDTYGQQAYAAVAPTSVVFDAAAFLGELREGLPSLTSAALKDSAKLLKGAGSDYLNVQFGWKPLISDLQKAGKALFSATQQLSDQGERLHRRHSRPPTLTSTSQSGSDYLYASSGGYKGFIPPTDPLFAADTGGLTAARVAHVSYDTMVTSSTKRWFEGSFSNFMPLGFDPNDYFQKLDALVNLKITPDVLWQLAPWSWLVDWQLKIGDTIAANQLAANDLLVMHYGYAMEESTYRILTSFRKTSDSTNNGTYSGSPSNGTIFSEITRKRRIRANPYGFKVGSGSQLNADQWAILGALGLSKSR